MPKTALQKIVEKRANAEAEVARWDGLIEKINEMAQRELTANVRRRNGEPPEPARGASLTDRMTNALRRAGRPMNANELVAAMRIGHRSHALTAIHDIAKRNPDQFLKRKKKDGRSKVVFALR